MATHDQPTPGGTGILRHCQMQVHPAELPVPATHDAKTIWGPWAYLCTDCLTHYGIAGRRSVELELATVL